MTFGDFKLLLGTPEFRPVLARLLSKWYDYELVGRGNDVYVRSRDGHRIDLQRLHLSIQADAEKSRELYFASMALWR
jgi:hypothetical protein